MRLLIRRKKSPRKHTTIKGVKDVVLMDDTGKIYGTVSELNGRIKVKPLDDEALANALKQNGIGPRVDVSDTSGLFSRIGPYLTPAKLRGFYSMIRPYLTPANLIWFMFYGLIAYALVTSLVRGELV